MKITFEIESLEELDKLSALLNKMYDPDLVQEDVFVDDMDLLTTRTKNSLKTVNINSLRDMIGKRQSDFLSILWIGKSSLLEIIEQMQVYGIRVPR